MYEKKKKLRPGSPYLILCRLWSSRLLTVSYATASKFDNFTVTRYGEF